MNRRGFLGMSLAAAGMVFAPKFGRWHRQGSGLLVPRPVDITSITIYNDSTGEVFYHGPPASFMRINPDGMLTLGPTYTFRGYA